jgi:hypothetical protein
MLLEKTYEAIVDAGSSCTCYGVSNLWYTYWTELPNDDLYNLCLSFIIVKVIK